MRFVLAASAALCLMAPVAFFACSSSDGAQTNEQDQSSDASTKPEEEDSDDNEEPSNPAPTNEGDGGSTENDATAPPSDTDAGTLCSDDSVRESESNNDIASGTLLPGTGGVICGRVVKDDPDFIKFVLPEDARTFGWEPEAIEAIGGNANFGIQLFINGEQTSTRGSVPFEPGAEYAFKLSNSSKFAVDYRIRIDIE